MKRVEQVEDNDAKLELSEMHVFGQRVAQSKGGNDCSAQEGLKGGTVWTALDESFDGRAKLTFERIWKIVTDDG